MKRAQCNESPLKSQRKQNRKQTKLMSIELIARE